MKAEFKYDGWHDFRARYSGTFGWYERPNREPLLVQLIDVEENICKFIDDSGMSFTAIADKGNHFSFLPVQKGVYNSKQHGVVFCQRVPARQYKRGLCESNTQLKHIRDNYFLDLTFDLVNDLFRQKDYNTALARFKATHKGDVALDSNFAFVDGKVYVFDNIIGTHDEKDVILNDKMFKQEMEDVLAACGITMFVKLKE